MEYSANPDTYFKNKGLGVKKRKPRIDWVRKAIESCHTQADWQELVRSMDAKSQVDALIRVQPKEIKGESSISVKLIIEGLKQPGIIEGKVIESLPEHIENDDLEP